MKFLKFMHNIWKKFDLLEIIFKVNINNLPQKIHQGSDTVVWGCCHFLQVCYHGSVSYWCSTCSANCSFLEATYLNIEIYIWNFLHFIAANVTKQDVLVLVLKVYRWNGLFITVLYFGRRIVEELYVQNL